MATFVLPVPAPAPAFFAFTVELDGRAVVVELRWNERAASWFLSLAERGGVALLAGRRVVADAPLVGRLRARDGVPPGELVAVDTGGRGEDPDRADLGTRVQLIYIEAADLAEAA